MRGDKNDLFYLLWASWGGGVEKPGAVAPSGDPGVGGEGWGACREEGHIICLNNFGRPHE